MRNNPKNKLYLIAAAACLAAFSSLPAAAATATGAPSDSTININVVQPVCSFGSTVATDMLKSMGNITLGQTWSAYFAALPNPSGTTLPGLGAAKAFTLGTFNVVCDQPSVPVNVSIGSKALFNTYGSTGANADVADVKAAGGAGAVFASVILGITSVNGVANTATRANNNVNFPATTNATVATPTPYGYAIGLNSPTTTPITAGTYEARWVVTLAY